MDNKLEAAVASFRSNQTALGKILNFDQSLLQLATEPLGRAQSMLEESGHHGAARKIKNSIDMLDNVKTNGSLHSYYEIFHTQTVVLLVSYFASALSDIFKESIVLLSQHAEGEQLNEIIVKLKFGEISKVVNRGPDQLGGLIADQEKLTFQDMNSVRRAFDKYFNVNIERKGNQVVDDIIFAQAARHIIVHDSGIVNNQMLNQVRDCECSFGVDVGEGKAIAFTDQDIQMISDSMLSYLEDLVSRLNKKLLV